MRLFTSTAVAAFMGLTAFNPAPAAEVKCTQPEANWKPVEELKAKLIAEEGWTISNVKTQTGEGCYEVYGSRASCCRSGEYREEGHVFRRSER